MKIAKLFVAFLLAVATPALAQTAPDRGKAQPAPPGPLKIPDAPQLPYHFGQRPVAPLGEKFGNVAAIALHAEWRPSGLQPQSRHHDGGI